MEPRPSAEPHPSPPDPGTAVDAAQVEASVLAWGDAVALEQRRALERRITESVRGLLARRAQHDLARLGAAGGPTADDAVHQVVVELPTVIAAYLENLRRRPVGDERGPGFVPYLMRAARNITRDLVSGLRRHRRRLERLAESYPSRLARTPTTPSQYGMRAEVGDLLARELAALDGLDREIVERHSAGESLAEIGRTLGLARETVRDRFRHAAARLRRAVERALGGAPDGG